MPNPPPNHPVLRAAKFWRDRCLQNGGSVFTDGSLWTSENIKSLVKYYAENLDEGLGDFLDKLEKQLAPSPGNVKHLAAEMLWVMYLFPAPQAMQTKTKLQHIRRVWEWSNDPLPDAPFQLEECLGLGVGHPGRTFHSFKWRELLFFIQMMEEWVHLPAPERQDLLANPWGFAEWLEKQDEAGKRQLRHILLYLFFPDHFEPFASPGIKEKIVCDFAVDFGEDPAAFDYANLIAFDKKLLSIRKKLQERDASPDFDFHDEPYLKIWRPLEKDLE